jgi:L-asparagine transporter-like permease
MTQDNNLYAPPRAEVADVSHLSTPPGTAPKLWNPNAAASWSLLFTPVFGAWLQMKNWQALGEPEKAAISKNWMLGTAVFMVLAVLLSVVLPDERVSDVLGRVSGLALLITWYYLHGKSQNAYVEARFGKTYPRQNWGRPLLLGLLAYVGFLVLSVAVGFAAGMLLDAA